MQLNEHGHPSGLEHFCSNKMCPGRAGMFSKYKAQESHMDAHGIEAGGELVPFRRYQRTNRTRKSR